MGLSSANEHVISLHVLSDLLGHVTAESRPAERLADTRAFVNYFLAGDQRLSLGHLGSRRTKLLVSLCF